jgi:hypothetical protein
MPDRFPANTTTPDMMSEDFPALAHDHRMPDVILIGAAKSATTLLTRWIGQHPAIGLCNMREPNFFSHPERFSRGLDWYSQLFAGVREDQLALDSSTGYTQWPQFPLAAQRIAHYAPRARLIYMMRHPVDRAHSHYVHRWTKECHAGEPFRMSFEDYVKQDPICLDGSNYRAQLEWYLDHFPSESLLCLFTFQFAADPVAVLQRICRFLGISDAAAPFRQKPADENRASSFLESRIRIEVTDRIKQLPGIKQVLPCIPAIVRERLYQIARRSSLGRTTAERFEAPPMRPETRGQLIERFAESNAWVAEFTGQDLSCWNQ